jgi:isopenicillin N synthase-like dioxygenase
LPPTEDRFTGEERMTRERYSIPYFIAPDEAAPVETLSACISKEKPARYEPIKSYGDYRIMRGSVQYESKRPESEVVAAAG